MTRQKRIALTLDSDYHALLSEIAAAQNKSVTTVVKEMLESALPVALAIKKTFDDLKAGVPQDEALRKLMAESLKAATDELNRED